MGCKNTTNAKWHKILYKLNYCDVCYIFITKNKKIKCHLVCKRFHFVLKPKNFKLDPNKFV